MCEGVCVCECVCVCVCVCVHVTVYEIGDNKRSVLVHIVLERNCSSRRSRCLFYGPISSCLLSTFRYTIVHYCIIVNKIKHVNQNQNTTE